MIIKFTHAIIFFFLLVGVAQAQNGTVKGVVKTSDGQPAEAVNIGLKGTSKGTFVNAKGEYEIKNVTPGAYTLVATFVGLETREERIDVKSGTVTAVPDIILAENSLQLNEVVV